MTTAQELKERFHQCMPLFIALGDEMRLSIIEVLTAEAMDCKQQAGPIIFEDHALNVNEITKPPQPLPARHLTSSEDFEGSRHCGHPPGRHCQLLLPDPEGIQPQADGTWVPAGRIYILNSSICIRPHFPDILILSISGR